MAAMAAALAGTALVCTGVTNGEEPCASGAACARIVANGGGAVLCTVSLVDDIEWRRFLPNDEVQVFSTTGELLLQSSSRRTGRNHRSSAEDLARALAAARAADGVLIAVSGGYPFFVPQAPIGTRRTIALDGGRSVVLETLSQKPRVSMADGVLDASECAAIRAMAEPRLEADTTLRHGQGVRSNFQRASDRTSQSALLPTPASGAPAAGGEGAVGAWPSLLLAVRERVAALVGMHHLVAEQMQVVRYRPGEHYHYHLDTDQAA